MTAHARQKDRPPAAQKKGTAKAIPFSLVAEAGFEPTTFGL